MLLFEATELIDDHVISAGVPEPAEFVLLLSELTVRWFHDNRRFEVPWFAAHFNLTDLETQQGRATVVVNPTGLFRVSIFDRAQQPLHGRQLVLYCDRMTIQLVTDENGVSSRIPSCGFLNKSISHTGDIDQVGARVCKGIAD